MVQRHERRARQGDRPHEHRYADSHGILVALRGPEADLDSITLKPEHIDTNSTYRVTHWDDYVAAPPTEISGTELKEKIVTIAQTGHSVLIEYERVDR